MVVVPALVYVNMVEQEKRLLRFLQILLSLVMVRKNVKNRVCQNHLPFWLDAFGIPFDNICSMNYIKLNPQYTVRNEKCCSFIVKLEKQIDKGVKEISRDVFVVPSVVGFILAEIGKDMESASLGKLSLSLGINIAIIEHFVHNLIGKKESKITYNNQTFIIPTHLLVYSTYKDERCYHFEKGFSPFDKFVNKRPVVPFNVGIMVTTACSTNCIYCYAKRSHKISMPLQTIKKIIDECHDIGVSNVALTGGDVFARKDWHELLAYTISKGYYPFLSTKTPLTENDVKYLKEIGINKLQFSLDSIDSSLLKVMIGSTCTYVERVRQMFLNCLQYGVHLNIRSVITIHNGTVNNFSDLHAFLSHFDNITDWEITPAFYSEFKEEYKDYTPRNDQLASVSSYVEAQKGRFLIFLNKINRCGYQLKRFKTVEDFVKNNQICHAGNYMLSILATGICTPCEMLYDNPDFVLGNIYGSTLKNIWNSPKALSVCAFSQIDEMETLSPCKQCKVLDICRKSIDRRICFVDISKTLGNGYSGYPDPRCPKSTVTGYIL